MAWIAAIAASAAAANNYDEDESGNRAEEPIGAIMGILGLVLFGLFFAFMGLGNSFGATSWIFIAIIGLFLIIVPIKMMVVRNRNIARRREIMLNRRRERDEFISPRSVEKQKTRNQMEYCTTCGTRLSSEALESYRNGNAVYCQSCGQYFEPEN